jgi:hypothetical protein
MEPSMIAFCRPGHYPSREEIEDIYRARDEHIAALEQLPVVSIDDVAKLDRLGLCRVANDLWSRCSRELQYHLLNHSHHHIRSCAEISARHSPAQSA